MFFFNRPSANRQFGVAGSTYDFKKSRDGKITVDQGFLLVEELGRECVSLPHAEAGAHEHADSSGRRTCATFWSVAVGLIQQGCAAKPPTQPGRHPSRTSRPGPP